MTTVKLLSTDLLDSLEERWRNHGAKTPAIMEPGLDDAELEGIAAPLMFELPEEIRTLYRWHDGSSGYAMIWGRGMISLRSAVAEVLEAPSYDELRHPGWLRILDERPYLVADCTAAGREDPVPIWHYGPEWEPPIRPVFASVGDLVTFWINLIDDGLMYWDGTMWQIHDETISGETLESLRGVPQT